MLKILEQLISLVRERKKNSPDNSYTKKLLNIIKNQDILTTIQ